MARRCGVTATFKPSEFELYEVTVSAADGYPDALDNARAEAVRGVQDLMAAALNLYRDLADDVSAADEFEALVAGQDEDADDD
jgi:hypothetical protein